MRVTGLAADPDWNRDQADSQDVFEGDYSTNNAWNRGNGAEFTLAIKRRKHAQYLLYRAFEWHLP